MRLPLLTVNEWERASALFWPHVKKTGNCWLWTRGFIGRHGCVPAELKKLFYTMYAHRVSYILAKGPIPFGLVICHQCDNPPCVRPDHLEPGTIGENVRQAHERGLILGPNAPGSLRIIHTKHKGVRVYEGGKLIESRLF